MESINTVYTPWNRFNFETFIGIYTQKDKRRNISGDTVEFPLRKISLSYILEEGIPPRTVHKQWKWYNVWPDALVTTKAYDYNALVSLAPRSTSRWVTPLRRGDY